MSLTVYNRSVLRVKLAEWANKNGGICIELGWFDSMSKRWVGAVYAFETPFGMWYLRLPSDSATSLIAISSRFLEPMRAPEYVTNRDSGVWEFVSGEEFSLFRVFTDAAEKMLKGEVA